MSDKKKCCKAGALCGLSCGCGIIGGVAGWCLAKGIPDSIGIPRDIGVIKDHWLELSLGLAGVGMIGASSYFYFRGYDIKKEDTEGQEVDMDESKETDEEKDTTGEKNKFEEAMDDIKEKIEDAGKNIKRVFVPEDTEENERKEAIVEKPQFEEAMHDIKEKFEDAGENIKRVFVLEDTDAGENTKRVFVLEDTEEDTEKNGNE